MFIDEKFLTELRSMGIVSYREQETLFDIAKRCAATVGVPAAGGGAVAAAAIGGPISVGTLTIPAALAGALAGLFGGTFSCVMLNESMKQELRDLALRES